MRTPLPLVLALALTACTERGGDTDLPGVDADGDGFIEQLDCDDSDDSVFPGADEICNEVDDDCNGEVDDQALDQRSFYRDDDDDGYGLDGSVRIACFAPDGYAEVGGDCDDSDPDRSPDASEMCNEIDDDCNDLVDDDPVDGDPWFPDRDQDGYGGDAGRILACRPVAEHLRSGGDCDDSDPSINPEGQEICDDGEGDEDCDGRINDDDDSLADPPAWYVDADEDGYGDRSDPVFQCARPEGRIATGLDCEDTLPEVNPEAEEVCGNDLDDDCNDHAATCGVVGRMTVDLADSRWDAVQRGGELGTAVFGLPDQTGDGRGELGLTQPRFDETSTTRVNVGRIALVHGPALGGGIAIADRTVTHDVVDQRLGTRVEVAGDIDSDGQNEVWLSSNGASPASVRLLDLDGEVSLVLESDNSPWDAFGDAIAVLPDITEDGVSDVMVGAPRKEIDDPGPVGAVYLFDGADTGTLGTEDALAAIEGDVLGGECGAALTAPDTDGDGDAEVAIGCSGGSVDQGEVVLFAAPPTGVVSAADADTRLEGRSFDHKAGAALAHGDLNGDGYDDLVVGAPGGSAASSTWQGAVYVLYGPTLPSLDKATRTWTGERAKDRFGSRLAVGDVDGDDDDEVLVGVPFFDGNTGRAYLFDDADGARRAISADQASAVLLGETAGDFFGSGVAIVPDLDADGYDDAVIGASGVEYTRFGHGAAGAAWIWRGGPGY